METPTPETEAITSLLDAQPSKFKSAVTWGGTLNGFVIEGRFGGREIRVEYQRREDFRNLNLIAHCNIQEFFKITPKFFGSKFLLMPDKEINISEIDDGYILKYEDSLRFRKWVRRPQVFSVLKYFRQSSAFEFRSLQLKERDLTLALRVVESSQNAFHEAEIRPLLEVITCLAKEAEQVWPVIDIPRTKPKEKKFYELDSSIESNLSVKETKLSNILVLLFIIFAVILG